MHATSSVVLRTVHSQLPWALLCMFADLKLSISPGDYEFSLLHFTFQSDFICSLSSNISVQFSSVAQSCPTLWDPMNRSTPGLPVHHQLPGFTQAHIHRVRDAIQPSHPWSSPSPPALKPSQHQSFTMSQLFAWGGQSIGVSALASFLPKNTQDWSPLGWSAWIYLQSKGFLRVFSNTTVQKHPFFGPQLSSQSNSHICTWLLEKP